jgi:hypothetical protein
MNHLEAWHARHQKNSEAFKKAVSETKTNCRDMIHEYSETGNFDSENMNSISYNSDEIAEWLRLKEQFKKC